MCAPCQNAYWVSPEQSYPNRCRSSYPDGLQQMPYDGPVLPPPPHEYVYPWLSCDLAALMTACTFDVGAVPPVPPPPPPPPPPPLVRQRPATMPSAPV